MPYEFIGKDGRVIKAPTKAERDASYERVRYTQELRKKRKLAEEESIKKANTELDEYGQTPEQAAKRDYYVNLVQDALNSQVESAVNEARKAGEAAAKNAEYERQKDIEKVNFLKTGLSILGVASGAATLSTPLTSTLYAPLMNTNAVISGANAIADVADGDYGQLALNAMGMAAPFSKFRYNKPIPTATWGRIGSDYVIDFSKHGESVSLAGDIIGLIKQTIKNDQTRKVLEKMAIGGRSKTKLPTINRGNVIPVKGGRLINVGPGLYYNDGKSHPQGGMDMDNLGYPNLNTEGGEVEKVYNDGTLIVGSKEKLIDLHPDGSMTPATKKFGGNISPAQLMLAGVDAEKVNKVQDAYKDRFKLNDDGTKKKAEHGTKEYGTPQKLVAAESGRPVEVVVTPQGNYTGYMTSENSPIYADNDARIAASEQGRMDRVNKQRADNERIKNEIVGACKFVAENLPVVGDMITIKDAYNDYMKGNTLGAGVGLASLVLPFGIGKAIKHGKGLVKKVLNKADNISIPNNTVTATSSTNDLFRTVDRVIDELPNVNKFANEDAKVRIKNALREEGTLTPEIEKFLDDMELTYDMIYYKDLPNYIGGQFNDATKRITINTNLDPEHIRQTLTHEYEHYMRNALINFNNSKNTIGIKRYKNAKDNIDDTDNWLANINNKSTYTNREQDMLNDAYTFTDDFMMNHRDDVATTLEKGATNRELREIYYNALKPLLDKLPKEKLAGRTYKEILDKNIDAMNPYTLLQYLNNVNGYGRNFVQDIINKGAKRYNIDAPDDVVLKELIEKGLLDDKIKSIKEALKYVGMSAGVIGTGATVMNNNNIQMKFGGRLTVVPFTGKVNDANINRTAAKLGTKKKADLGTKDKATTPLNINKDNVILGPDGTYYYKDAKTGMTFKIPTTGFVNGKLSRLGEVNVNGIEFNDRPDGYTVTPIQPTNFNRDDQFSTIEFPVVDFSINGDIPWLNRVPGYTLNRPKTAEQRALRLAKAQIDADTNPVNFTPKHIRQKARAIQAKLDRGGEPDLGDIKQTPITLNIARPKNDNTTSIPLSVDEYTPTTVLSHDYVSPHSIIDYNRFIRPFTPPTATDASAVGTPDSIPVNGTSTTPTKKASATSTQPNGAKTPDKEPTEVVYTKPTTPTNVDPATKKPTKMTRTRVAPGSTVDTNDNIFTGSENPVPKGNIFKRLATDFKNNPSDYLSAGFNLFGSVGSWLANNIAINRMKAPSAPVPKLAAKLKTRININPQLDKMRETVGAYERNIRQNTASSAVALNRINRARFAGAQQVNQIFGQKENLETELINKDKLNQQAVAHTNVDSYNQYQDKLTDFRNRKAELRSENWNALAQGINATIQNGLLNRQKRNQYDRALKVQEAIYKKEMAHLKRALNS